MLKRKITKIKNQLKKNKSLYAGLICLTFQKCRLLIFFKVTFFRKITKKHEYLQYQTVWIQIRSNVFWALFARNVKPDLDPKLFLVDTSR